MNSRMKTRFAAFFGSIFSPKLLTTYILSLISSSLITYSAFAGVSFGYQGTLCDAQGAAVASKTKVIEFRLYKSTTAATAEALWGRSYTVKTGANGVFNVELTDDIGDKLTDGTPGTGLADIIAKCAAVSSSIYVGLTVEDSSGEIAPRQKMIATPYSAYAINVGTASGDFKVGGNLTVAGGIEMADATNSYLTAGTVQAQRLTCDGDAMLDSKLVVAGDAEAQQDLKVGGTLDVNDNATFSTNVTVKGNLKVHGALEDSSGEIGVPIGTIVMWSGSSANLPAGWVICDGQTTYNDPYSGKSRNVPDLRGRFVVGVGACYEEDGKTQVGDANYTVDARGGEQTHKLNANEMPSHAHNVSNEQTWNRIGLDLDQDQVEVATPSYWITDKYNNSNYVNKKGAGTFSFSVNSSSAGSDNAHENRPPYYALYYIIKVGK